jgi:hypothetical protein
MSFSVNPETLYLFQRYWNMEYRGFEYSVVRSIQRGKWRWSVSIENAGTKTGIEDCKATASVAAQRAISWLCAKKKRSLESAQ